jgi:hypothetical protein
MGWIWYLVVIFALYAGIAYVLYRRSKHPFGKKSAEEQAADEARKRR